MKSYTLLLLCCCLLALVGCVPQSSSEVVVYTALDREYSEPIFEQFTKETGIRVLAKYDVESTKTVGLVNAIIAEADRPRCDLFWNNEIMHTLRLQRRGLLSAYRSPQADAFPDAVRDPDGIWTGFAARARVLLVNTDLLAEADRPTSVLDLANERFKDRVAMAKPLAGTTLSHAVCLFVELGDEWTRRFLRDVKQNARILSGNKQVAMAVGRGQIAFGLTDTDDAMIEIAAGRPVAIIYPDQQEGQMGTLFIPNTLARIKGSKNGEAAEQLVDYLLSAKVETVLAKGPSAQIPLRRELRGIARVETPYTIRPLEIDFGDVAAEAERVEPFLIETFAQPD